MPASTLFWFFFFPVVILILGSILFSVFGVFLFFAATGTTYLAVRHGLLAFTVNIFVSQVALFTIFTVDPTDWYFPGSAIFVALIFGLTLLGVKVSAERVGPVAS